MKRVSFKVAKAIKEAGYTQHKTPYLYVTKDYSTFREGEMIDCFFENSAGNNVVDAPFAVEVWLWLWREKHIAVEADYSCANDDWFDGGICGKKFKDPEESIIAAIDYLVDSNLIK